MNGAQEPGGSGYDEGSETARHGEKRPLSHRSRMAGQLSGRRTVSIQRRLFCTPVMFLMFTALLTAFCLAAGCSDSAAPGHRSEAGRGGENTGGGPAPIADQNNSTKPDDAAEALSAVVDGFRQNRPEAIWEFLPPGHQRQINGLAREFAVRMDPELWQQTASVVRQSSVLLKTRKRQILSHPVFAEREPTAAGASATNAVAQKWDGFVALLETLSRSELSDLEQMKSFDGREFFARFDAQSLRQLEDLSILLSEDNPFSMLREMIDGASVRLVRESGGVATVRVAPSDGEPRDFVFVLVDGKWFPQAWANALTEDIKKARARFDVELAPDVLAQKKQLVLPLLEDAATILDELEGAETDAEFHNVMTERIIKPAVLIAEAAGGATGVQTPAAPVNLAALPENAVTIVVPAELEASSIDQIADELLSAGGVDRELTDEIANGRTLFVLTPVQDVAAFARTIKFGTVTAVDAEKRTITVKLPAPERRPEPPGRK